jgi:hypothetical protein
MLVLTFGGGPAYSGPAYGARQTEEVAFVGIAPAAVELGKEALPTLSR